MHVDACTWRSMDNLQAVSSFLLSIETQVDKIGGKCLYPLLFTFFKAVSFLSQARLELLVTRVNPLSATLATPL